MDELLEMLTLSQTRKLDRDIFILLYGSSYWHEVINFEALRRHGMIAPQDLGLLHFADDPATALRLFERRSNGHMRNARAQPLRSRSPRVAIRPVTVLLGTP